MGLTKKIFSSFSAVEKKWFFSALAVLVLASLTDVTLAIKDNSVMMPIAGGSYHEGFLGQPTALNPIISQNPIDQEISGLIFSRLSDLLSTSDLSADGRTYTLKLKENLKWDDGEPLTSDDVVFTIKTAQNSDVHSPFEKSWQGIAVERDSELEVKLTLPLSYTFFTSNINWLPIIPKHIFGAIPTENFRLSDYNLEPVGSGPYKFSNFTKKKNGFISQYHFVPNPNYAGDKPYIKDFYFNFFQNSDDLFHAIEIHDVNGFGSATPVDFDVSKTKGVTEQKLAMSDYYAIFFNQNSNPILKDDGIRAALESAVDKDQIIKEALNGGGTDVNAPGFVGNPPIGDNSNYNEDAAKKMISDFKAKNKNEQIDIVLTIPDVDFLEKTAALIKTDWENIGIDQVGIKTFNPDDPSDGTLESRDYEMLLFGNVFENPADLFPFWHSSQRIYPGFNLAIYQNQKVDNLIETIRQTNDEGTQANLLSQAQNAILNDGSAIFLFSLPYTYIHTSDLGGFNNDLVTNPAERFRNANEWYISQIRVIK